MLNLQLGIVTVIACVIGYYFAYRYFKKDNWKICLSLICLCGLILRIYTGTDLYLHTWDEQYHALVAKNLLNHMTKPTLYDNPVLPYNVENWVANNVWLEKPPIPLWMAAISLKIFGLSEIALRVPSITLSTIAIILTYLIGKFLFEPKVGILAAFLHSINGLLIEVAAGRVSSDLVETSFVFFIELGIFVSVYAICKNKTYLFSLTIGTLLGCSLLCKWNPALIILPVWFTGAYFSKKYSFGTIIIQGFLILLTGLSIYFFWISYILKTFPEESTFVLKKFVFAYNKTLEGHSGPPHYYLHTIGIIFGELIYVPLILTLYLLFKKQMTWQGLLNTAWWLIPLLVFSFAATKRQTYILIAAPAFFIMASTTWFYLKSLKPSKNYKYLLLIILSLLIILPIRYCIERVKPFELRDRLPEWEAQTKELHKKIDLTKKTVIFNLDRPIDAMFYNDCIAYSNIPEASVIEDLQEKGYKVILNDNGIDKSDYSANQEILIEHLVNREK
jgi:4-amino-4-deoxy-L-arabinose transferase